MSGAPPPRVSNACRDELLGTHNDIASVSGGVPVTEFCPFEAPGSQCVAHYAADRDLDYGSKLAMVTGKYRVPARQPASAIFLAYLANGISLLSDHITVEKPHSRARPAYRRWRHGSCGESAGHDGRAPYDVVRQHDARR